MDDQFAVRIACSFVGGEKGRGIVCLSNHLSLHTIKKLYGVNIGALNRAD